MRSATRKRHGTRRKGKRAEDKVSAEERQPANNNKNVKSVVIPLPVVNSLPTTTTKNTRVYLYVEDNVYVASVCLCYSSSAMCKETQIVWLLFPLPSCMCVRDALLNNTHTHTLTHIGWYALAFDSLATTVLTYGHTL